MSASPAVALEISCRYIEPILDLALERCDRREVAIFLESWQIDLEYLRNPSNWVSQRFVEDLTIFSVDRLGIDMLCGRVAAAARSSKALGFLVPLLRAFGSPRIGYAHLPRVAALISKVSRVTVLSIGRGRADIEFCQDAKQFKLVSPYLCELRKANLQAGPTFFGLPPATIEEPECQHRGEARCRYLIRWREPVRWRVFAPVGVAGGALGLWAGQGVWTALAGTFAGLAIGGVTRAWAAWRDGQRLEHAHFGEMELVAQAAERRFLEHQSQALPSTNTREPSSRPSAPGVAWLPITHTESTDAAYQARQVQRLQPGDVLADRYVVGPSIARGGMSEVFRAVDRQSGAEVALKLLRPDLARERSWIDRLEREFRLGRSIDHPNVCRMRDMGEADGHVFLVLELARAGTLLDLLRDPVRPRAVRLAEAEAVIAGLAAVHDAGIVHRDLTPRNVLRMDEVRLAVADFGLAIDPSETTTLVGGTPGYLAPEVLKGLKPSFSSDVWQLGVVLHQVLTGERPLAEQLAASAPLATDGAVRVARSCLAEDPRARPPDAKAVMALWVSTLASRPAMSASGGQ